MTMSESLEALRRANPRAAAGFGEAVDAAAKAVRSGLAVDDVPPPRVRRADRRRLVSRSAVGAALVVAVAAVVALTIPSTGGGPGVEDAAAAIKQAASVSAASAELSGTAVVRMTHG